MSCLVILELQIKPDMFAEAKQFFRDILADTRAFDGCQRLIVNQDEANSILLLTEEWDSAEKHQKYMAWRSERGDVDKIGAFVAAPPSIRHLDMTDI